VVRHVFRAALLALIGATAPNAQTTFAVDRALTPQELGLALASDGTTTFGLLAPENDPNRTFSLAVSRLVDARSTAVLASITIRGKPDAEEQDALTAPTSRWRHYIDVVAISRTVVASNL